MNDTGNRDDERRRKLGALRRKVGLSQEGLAERLQASRSSVYRWEAGEAVPQPRLLALWAEVLGIETDELDDLLWSGETIVRPVTGGDTEQSTDPPNDSWRAAVENPGLAADLVRQTADRSEIESYEFAEAVVALLGLDQVQRDRAASLQVAVALSSFRGANSINHEAAAVDLGGPAPKSFVQAYDDVANDYFFGKRDVLLANQISGALTSIGFKVPIYVDDRSVWRQLCTGRSLSGGLVIQHEGEAYEIDVLVVVGLWSNVLATGLADWGSFPEFQMAGNPARHAERTVRFATSEGLRILDLNSSDETEELGGNPAVLITRKLPDLHVVLAGGATSLSTLRLAELLTNRQIWQSLTMQVFGGDEQPGPGGSWVAIECPNAAKWKDRCRIVGSGHFDEPITETIDNVITIELDQQPNESTAPTTPNRETTT